MVNLVSPWLPVVRSCTKVLQLRTTNLLFGLYKSVWVIDLLVNLPSPISKLQHAPLPSKCYEPRSAPQLLLIPLSSPLDSQLSPSKSLGVCHQESNYQFDSWPPKVKNLSYILACKWRAVPHTIGKRLMKAITLLQTSPQSKVFIKKIWPLKSWESQFQEFWDSQLESLETKWYLGVGHVARHREYYKEEGGGFSQVQAMANFVKSCLLVAHPCTKNVWTTH